MLQAMSDDADASAKRGLGGWPDRSALWRGGLGRGGLAGRSAGSARGPVIVSPAVALNRPLTNRSIKDYL